MPSNVIAYYAAIKGLKPAAEKPDAPSGTTQKSAAKGDDSVAKLKQRILELERQVSQLKGGETPAPAQPARGKKKKKKGRKAMDLKTPKDYGPSQMAVREWVFDKITNVFKRHGAQTIDTPVFELKELLTSKYGEDSKLIYDLKDQGGEDCSLRYDLTVPFARYLAMNREKSLKRFHIGRVYRRDQPSKAKGRLREFYQCDFDIAGQYNGNMLPDSEVLCVAIEALEDLELGAFEVKVNHRLMLDAVFAVCGVPKDLFQPICSAVDKLDKMPWEEVKAEMITKTLKPEICDKLWSYVQKRSPTGEPGQLIAQLEADEALCKNKSGAAALKELKLLFNFLSAMGKQDKVVFDLSLARGLDYYTGVIFEAVQTGEDNQLAVGSIAGGGRYDNLVGSLGGEKIPCIGFSLGIERIFVIVELLQQKMAEEERVRECAVDVVVCPVCRGGAWTEERMRIVAMLWKAGIRALVPLKQKPKIGDVLGNASKLRVPFAVIFGGDELANDKLKIKDLNSKVEIECSMAGLVDKIIELRDQ